jgi:hypothetical protein
LYKNESSLASHSCTVGTLLSKIFRMKYDTDPKRKWIRKNFDENILNGLSVRERSEIETERDLIKPVEQLVCDVHEETHNEDRTAMENLASAQKRMVSLMARVALSNDRVGTKMLWLTWAIAFLTLVIVGLTVALLIKG